MRESGENTNKNKKIRLSERRSFMFALSVVIAIIAWMLVSMNQTNEVEKDFPNVKVQLNVEGSLPANNNLSMFGSEEIYVDVSVRGKSYLVNDSGFADHLSVTASLNSVTAAGTYSLPISATINGYTENDVSITKLSKSSISVYFDEKTEKSFSLTEEIVEGENYKLPEGYQAENARLSAESVTLIGPALQMNRITAVKAVATIDKELTATENFKADIIPVAGAEGVNFEYVTVKDEEPIFITVPVTFSSEFKPVINFTNMPKIYRDTGVPYTISPESVKVAVPAEDEDLMKAEELTVGTIDFSQINNINNSIEVSVADSQYTFSEGVTKFTVNIDMSGMEKRWMEVPVSESEAKLPEGAKLVSTSVLSVQIVGPGESVLGIDSSEAYAVPVLDGVELKSGLNTVPAKIVLRTLTDSWVRGEYTVDIQVD